ncbi:MAG: glycerol-3-phosphate 1-O-acyltransferase [Acidimicrobiia bacterium]|nr:glycerol-3-phosphate 1-O-acyltransferase [Acidimicrobiia bacterium]
MAELRAVRDEDPWPSSAGEPIVFLLDASSPVERRLLTEWLQRNRPDGTPYRLVDLPTRSRRLAMRPASETDFRAELESAAGALLVPLRVAWFGPGGPRRRTPRLLDLIALGDARDPSRIRQEWIARFRPDRARVVRGDAATVDELRSRWVAARARAPEDPHGFADYVALQASLALERAERRIRGNRYKVPRFLAEDLTGRSSFRLGVLRLADELGEDPEDVFARTEQYLDEIAATHSTYVIDLIAALIRVLYTQGYHRRIDYDREELQRLAELGQQHSLVFLPSHKSQLDHLVLMYLLYENGLPPNHTAGGINMNFFPVGPLIRRAGVFFIRRSFKDNEPYKFTLKQYLDYLLSKRFPLEWFMEGGRSRSGKLREPRYGMMAYVADSYRRGSAEDAVLLPVSIAYDQIQDVGDYAAEQRGARKQKESFAWMVRAIRSLRRRYGRIYVRFGEPIHLSDRLSPYEPGDHGDPDDHALEVQKLAFEVGTRINRVTPITPISLVTLALLGNRERALTVAETCEVVAEFVDDVRRRGLPTTEPLHYDTPEQVQDALDALVEHGVVTRHEGGTQTVYEITHEQHLAAAYYRNTIIHFFTTGAIAELALIAAADAPADREVVFWEEIAALRDLLKFEFYFSERAEFRAEVEAELADADPDWRTALAGSREDVLTLLRSTRPYAAHWVLRPIVEAYHVVADALAARDHRFDVDRKAFVDECLALGRQYLAQRRIRSPEGVSSVLYDTAIKLAANRGLLDGGDVGILEARGAWAAEVAELVRRIDAVSALVRAHRTGMG